VAKALLAHERTMIGAMGSGGGAGRWVRSPPTAMGVDDEGRLDDPMLRARIAELEVDLAAFNLAMERVGDQVKARQVSPAIASMLKYYGSELNKRRHELLMAAGARIRWSGRASGRTTARRPATGCAPRPTPSKAGPARCS
jgi:alkylation response protein AidB-like acyl-CoA dehydrogenase